MVQAHPRCRCRRRRRRRKHLAVVLDRCGVVRAPVLRLDPGPLDATAGDASGHGRRTSAKSLGVLRGEAVAVARPRRPCPSRSQPRQSRRWRRTLASGSTTRRCPTRNRQERSWPSFWPPGCTRLASRRSAQRPIGAAGTGSLGPCPALDAFATPAGTAPRSASSSTPTTSSRRSPTTCSTTATSTRRCAA